MTPRLSRLVFSLNSFAAAMLALFIALGLGLVNPYWSAMTVYIVSQPQAGSVRSKALYRLIGTAIGGGAAVAFVPLLVDAPELLSLALACWVGTCLGVSLLDRTPRSYAFMLSGYTAALIGFPAVGAPAAIFDTAVARVEEIGLGIVCATLIHSIVLPHGIARTLEARIEGFLRDAQRWVLDALAGAHDPRSADAHKLAGDITELHILATHLPFDTSHYQDRSHEVGKLAERMALLLPVAESVGDRLDALRQAGAPLPPEADALLTDIAGWVRAGQAGSIETAGELMARTSALEPALGPQPGEVDLLRASFHARLAELIATWRDCVALARHLRDGTDAPAAVRSFLADARVHRLHRDYGMAAWSGLTATCTILTVCAFWIATGWPDGGTAAMMAGIFTSFFAAMDDPAKAIDGFALWWTLSIPVAAVYLFAIMPMLTDFPMLVLALAPTFLLAGYLMAIPRWTPRALPALLGVSGALSIQESFTPNFAQFANLSIATLAGVFVASAVTRLVRSVGADFSAGRIVRLAQRDLARLAGTEPALAVAAWTGLMVDRVALLGARVAPRGDPDDLVARTLRTMRIGLNLLALRRTGPREHTPAVAGLLDALRRYWRHPSPEDDTLPARIDAAVAEIAGTPDGAARRDGLLALAGLRRALFPDDAKAPPA